MSRILAIDYGERRLGIAVTDPTRTISSPLVTLTRRMGKRPPWKELERLVREYDVSEIVVGLPLNPAGDETEWSAEVRQFGEQVGRRTGLPVHLVDERHTSIEAERFVRGSGLKRTQREEKGRIDATAASIILRNYLDRLPRG